MSDHLGQQIVILTTVWRWQKLGTDYQRTNKHHTDPYEEVQSQDVKQGRV
jgi:hypothetical protein